MRRFAPVRAMSIALSSERWRPSLELSISAALTACRARLKSSFHSPQSCANAKKASSMLECFRMYTSHRTFLSERPSGPSEFSAAKPTALSSEGLTLMAIAM
jgi:hypothetical protein